MERKLTLELVQIVLNSFNRNLETWGSHDWIEEDTDLILRKADALGDLYKMNGGYYGTIRYVCYKPAEKDISQRLILSFEEWDEMKRPKRIQETRTYEPIETAWKEVKV